MSWTWRTLSWKRTRIRIILSSCREAEKRMATLEGSPSFIFHLLEDRLSDHFEGFEGFDTMV